MKKIKKILIVANVDWIFLLHRLPIAKAVQKLGFNVMIAAKDTGQASRIKQEGFGFVNLNITRSGTHLFQELFSFVRFYKIYKQIKPDVLYQITMKPVVYGSVIAKILNIKTVNGISGLGYNFSGDKKGVVQKVMVQMMRFGFAKKNNHLIFENNDDRQELLNLKIIKDLKNTTVVKGVGVDLEKYKPTPKQSFLDKTVFLLPTRMLWDKGVKEFIEAAKILENKYKGQALFRLCGMIDKDNKECVAETYLINSQIKDYIVWEGHHTNTFKMYRDADIVVLPSYREGMPTVLLEASAMGKPIITTDAPGCKDCVDEGINGYKVPVKSVKKLADAMEKTINSPVLRQIMGEASRSKAAQEFDQKGVVQKHLDIFRQSSISKK